jgi:hypothetical protein
MLYIIIISVVAFLTATQIKKIFLEFCSFADRIQGILNQIISCSKDLENRLSIIKLQIIEINDLAKNPIKKKTSENQTNKRELSNSQILKFGDIVDTKIKVKVGKNKNFERNTIELDDTFAKTDIWQMDKQINFK